MPKTFSNPTVDEVRASLEAGRTIDVEGFGAFRVLASPRADGSRRVAFSATGIRSWCCYEQPDSTRCAEPWASVVRRLYAGESPVEVEGLGRFEVSEQPANDAGGMVLPAARVVLFHRAT